MARRPDGSQSVVMTAGGSVKSDPGIVYSLIIAYEGAKAGDNIGLRDGGALGTVKFYVTLPAANGTLPIELGRYGIKFITDIYYTEQAALGKIRTTIVCD